MIEMRSGFSVVEMIVIMAVIATLAAIVFGPIANSQARARDGERITDIENLHSKLEEYRTDKGGYPNTFTADTFGFLDPEVLVDPSGTSITILSPVANQAVALTSGSPSRDSSYVYIPYPTGCGATNCKGYVLKTFVEIESEQMPNPTIRTGIHNN